MVQAAPAALAAPPVVRAAAAQQALLEPPWRPAHLERKALPEPLAEAAVAQALPEPLALPEHPEQPEPQVQRAGVVARPAAAEAVAAWAAGNLPLSGSPALPACR